MKVHCLFEQSGTFKNVFKKYNIDAFDYDLCNDFGETDFILDIFNHIESAYNGKESIFDTFSSSDLIFAFFPCVRFTHRFIDNFKINGNGRFVLDFEDKLIQNISYFDSMSYFYKIFNYLFIIANRLNLRLIVENPYRSDGILNRFFYLEPTIVDKCRLIRGDDMRKPTMYYFFNVEPSYNILFDNPTLFNYKKVSSLNKVERSLISSTYAENFIREFIF